MRIVRVFRWGSILCLAVSLYGQRPAPIADQPDQEMIPAGISELPTTLSGQLAYMFKDDDGTEAVHVVGSAQIQLGEQEGQNLEAREAVVWISHRLWNQRPYRHLEIFLWRDAQIREIGGTMTLGPALFVTLDTFGPLGTEVDEFAFESSANTQVYTDGSKIRAVLAADRGPRGGTDAPIRVFDPTGLRETAGPPRPPPVVHFQSKGEFKGPFAHDGHRVISVIGRVYLARGTPASEQFLEIQADSAVVFLDDEGGGAPAIVPEDSLGGQTKVPSPPKDAEGQPGAAPRKPRPARPDQQILSAGFGDTGVAGVYLEGDVLMTSGVTMIRASRLYYDFVAERALILDAVVRTIVEERGVPLYVRAGEVRQLSSNRFAADDALLTTSEFHTPHYHIGASHVEVMNRSPSESGGKPGPLRVGSFRIEDATLNVEGVPVGYWPSIRGTVDTSETSIKSLRTGYSDDFGFELETEWNLFNLMGLEDPEGFDTSLSLDYFSERGPAVGIDSTYEREKYFGLLRSYLINDDGVDHLSQNRTVVPPNDLRGRFLLRHRDYLADDWQLTFELSYISDRTFLEEYFESEFQNDKDQETLLYLKRQRDNWAFTATLQARILDFTTQTERLPDFSYFRIGEPLPLPGRLRSVLDQVTWFTENRLGAVRYRPADQAFTDWLSFGSPDSSGTTLRGDTRQEITTPLNLGPVRLAPFAAVRGTAWSESIDDGSLARAYAVYGVRGSTYFSKVYPDSNSAFLDIDGIRHVIKPDITVWASQSNVGSDELYPFDQSVEGIDPIDGVSFGVRQRWQTKRGRGANRRNVDVFTLDTELGAFNDAPGDDTTNGFTSYSRPENSITRNYFNNAVIWRINDRTALLNEVNYDLNNSQLGVTNVSLAVERTPRMSYLLGYRYIQETESNLLGFDLNYKLTEKYTLAVREAFDLDQGQSLDFTIALIRKNPRWYSAVAFQVDEAEDDFGVSFSIWPEGINQAALGSKRFTGLANSTRLGGQ